MLRTNLYDYKIYFAIIFNEVYTEIGEPKNWNKIIMRIPRDKENFGFTSDFLEDNYGLEFTYQTKNGLNGGAALLQEIYETRGQGADAEVYFEFGNKATNTRIPINRWRINLNEYSRSYTGVKTSIEKLFFQALFRSRKSAPVQINSYANFDGEPLTPISALDLTLHGKTVEEFTEVFTQGNPPSNEMLWTVGGGDNTIIIQPDFSNHIFDEINQVFTQPVGLISTGDLTTPAAIDIFNNEICQINLKYSGITNFVVSADFDLWWFDIDAGIGLAPANISGTLFDVTPRLVIQRKVGGVQTLVQDIHIDTTLSSSWTLDSLTPGMTVGTPPDSSILPSITDSALRTRCVKVPFVLKDYDVNFSNLDLQAGDNIYLNFVIHFRKDFTGLAAMQLNKYHNDITISQFSIAPSTNCLAYKIIDILNQQMECITGMKNRVKSNFFSPGGGGYNYALANGYSIRNYGAAEFTIKKSLEETLSDLQAVFCTGYGFQTIAGEEYLVIEPVSNFFQNKLIDTFTEVFDWTENHSNEFCFNEAHLGFSKYALNELRMLDEFATDGSFLMQWIRTHNNVLEKKCNLIASGYTIELQRRNQFSANISGSNLIFDEDVFIVATTNKNVFQNIPYIILDDTGFVLSVILQSDFITINPGDRVAFSFANPDYIYTAIARMREIFIFISDPSNTLSPTSALANCTVILLPNSVTNIFAESNEIFEVCQNVIDPTTIYNGRLSIKHILYNWSPVLAIGLWFVDPNSPEYQIQKIFPTLPKMNSVFTTQYLSTEPNKGYVGDKILVENSKEFVKDYDQSQALFLPTGAKFSVRVGFNQMNLYRSALCGETGNSEIDFGGFVAPDDFGRLWFCHVMDLSYDPVKELATFEVQKVMQIN